MNTSTMIDINYKQAKKQAEKLEEIADRLSKLSKNNMQNSLKNIAASWKGDNATKFLKKGEKLDSDINVTASELRRVAKDIRNAAEKVYRAEMEAVRIAQTKSYNS